MASSWDCGAATMRCTWRSPGVQGLVEGDGPASHGIAVHIAETQSDLARDAGGGEVLRGAGNGFEVGVFRTCAERGEGDALGGAVEASRLR